MLSEAKVGPQLGSDGSILTIRADKTGAPVFAQAHGAYAEPAYRGAIMDACNSVAGIAHGTALSTTPPICLWNPPSSGKNLSILKVSLGYVSGTLGAGSIVYGVVPSQVTVPSGGTELTPQCALLGAPRGVGRAFAGSTLAATPTILRPAFTIGAFAGGANTPIDTIDIVDGSIIVALGTVFVVQGIATAGTSPLVIFAITYEEIPA